MNPLYLQLLIPAVSPAITAFVRKLAPKIPKVALPAVCAASGVALEALRATATGTPIDPQAVTMAGAAGVGLREVVNQFGKRRGSVK